MKKLVPTLLASAFLLFSAATASAEQDKIIAKPPVAQTQFQLVDESKLSDVERTFVDIAKEHKGVFKFGNLYVISAGPKPNTGYDLKFEGQEQILEQLKVYVKQTTPEPGKMYAQMIVNPHIVVRADLPPYTTLTVLDADSKKPFDAEQNFQLVIKDKQTTNYNKKMWSINLDRKITKEEFKTYKVTVKKLGEIEKVIPATVFLDMKTRQIKVVPRGKYENGSYVIEVVNVTKQNTKVMVLPFEVKR